MTTNRTSENTIQAKNLLKGDLQIVLVKDDKVIKIFDKGIAPWVEMVDMAWDLSGFSIATTYLSSGAAYMCELLKVSEVYADKISANASSILKRYDIKIDPTSSIEEYSDDDFIADDLQANDVYTKLKDRSTS